MILKSALADLSFIQYTIIDFIIEKRGSPKDLRSFWWPDLRKKPSVLESLKFFQVCFCPFLFVRAAHTLGQWCLEVLVRHVGTQQMSSEC